MSNVGVFKRICGALDAEGISYMLVGSFASSYYGAIRSSGDIDFEIAASRSQVCSLINRLSETEYYCDASHTVDAYRNQSAFHVIDKVTGFKIDLIFVNAGEFNQEAFRRRCLDELEGNPIFVSTPEDVIIEKLEWTRLGHSLRQIEDISRLLKLRWDSLDHAYLKKWITQLGLDSQWNNAKQSPGFE